MLSTDKAAQSCERGCPPCFQFLLGTGEKESPFFVGPEHFKGNFTPLPLSPPAWDNLQALPFSANCSHQRSNNTAFLLTPFYTLKRISLSPDSPSRAENILSSTSSCYFPSPLKTFILLNSFHCNTYFFRLFLTHHT